MYAAATLKEELKSWSGFPHAVFLQSGSAATTLAIELFGLRDARIALPAITCWTLTGAIWRAGATPQWEEVDASLTQSGISGDPQAVLYPAPWGNPDGWEQFSAFSGVRIADLTLCPFGGEEGAAAEHFDAAVISLGQGKPWAVGAGGILLVRDETLARKAGVYLSYGREGSRWSFLTDRYVFSPHLFAPALEAWLRLKEQAAEQAQSRTSWAAMLKPGDLPLTPVTLTGGGRPGATVLVPHLLDESYPLDASDLCIAALAEGLPILEQPVSPAYAEPAGGGRRGLCPRSEQLARRLVFVPTAALTAGTLGRFRSFFALIQVEPERFRRPYPVKAHPAPIDGAQWPWTASGILARRANGSFCVFDPASAKRFAISDSVAAGIQYHAKESGVLW